MRKPSLALVPLLPLALGAALRQEPAQEPLPAGVVARVDGVEIGVEEYKEFLWRQMGTRLISQLVDEKLVEAACARFSVEADPAAVEAAIEERLAQMMTGRTPEEVEKELGARGIDMETVRNGIRIESRRNLRLDELVRATRVATDARVQAAFEAEYGPGGVRIELRQVLCMPHVLRAERIRGGADPASLDADALRAEARTMAATAQRRIAGGEDFARVAEELSHDQTSRQQGGQMTAYRPGVYGEAFGAAVEALAVGAVSDVIESGAGFHVLQVTARTVTTLAQVRDPIVRSVLEAAPTWQEREELLAGLRGQAKIELQRAP